MEPPVLCGASFGMARKLKVFRTAAGFHDAYVAAPSQKAALMAWGSDANLFARGIAEEVTEAALTAEPLAHPGEVIRVARGTSDEHMAALPKAKRAPSGSAKHPPAKARAPRPSRHALEAAETALAEAKADFDMRDSDLAKRESAIAAERKAFDRRVADETRTLEDTRETEKAKYDRALEKWEPE